jgi:hypothetical protein
MKDKKQTPSDSPKSSGEIEIMHVKNTNTLLFFILVVYSFLLQINVFGLLYKNIEGLQHERTYRFE